MAERACQGLGVDEFYAWLVLQERKYELVHGQPMLMAGANRRHDRIAANAIRVVGNQLQGKRCQPFTNDTYVRMPAGNLGLPDLGVDCGPFEDTSLEASEPILVVEILSPKTRTFDRYDQIEEYKTHPSCLVGGWRDSGLLTRNRAVTARSAYDDAIQGDPAALSVTPWVARL